MVVATGMVAVTTARVTPAAEKMLAVEITMVAARSDGVRLNSFVLLAREAFLPELYAQNQSRLSENTRPVLPGAEILRLRLETVAGGCHEDG